MEFVVTANGAPIDLTGAQLTLRAKAQTGSAKFGGEVTALEPYLDEDGNPTGKARYDFGAADTSRPGLYNLEVVVQIEGQSEVLVFPNGGYRQLNIVRNLA